MKRLQKVLSQQKKFLSPYITAGDPDPDTTVRLLHQFVKSGADILELGIPFSDPMAEGPVIQAAMERALAHHVTLLDVLAMVSQFRQQDQHTPVVLMGYVNPIEIMGYQAFAERAAAVGVDAMIVVDLPPEEAQALYQALHAKAIDLIFLFSPTTTDQRMKAIHRLASGYLYYVTLKGVTGAGHLNVQAVAEVLEHRRQETTLPIFAGFGIRTAEDAARLASVADGVVIGSALVELIAQHAQSGQDIFDAVDQFLVGVAKALR